MLTLMEIYHFTVELRPINRYDSGLILRAILFFVDTGARLATAIFAPLFLFDLCSWQNLFHYNWFFLLCMLLLLLVRLSSRFTFEK